MDRAASRVRREGPMEMEVEEAWFPLVVITVPEQLDLAVVDRFSARYGRILARKLPFVTLSDASQVTSRPDALVRKRIAEWSRDIQPQLVELSKGDARVVKSALIRGAMTAVGWLHQHPVEQKWFTTVEDAAHWSLDRLAQAHVPIPSAVKARFDWAPK